MNGIAAIALMLVGFGCAAYFTGKVLYHGFHIVTNVRGRHSSFLGPLALIVRSQLTAEGARHRKPLGAAMIGVIIGWTLLFAVGAVDA